MCEKVCCGVDANTVWRVNQLFANRRNLIQSAEHGNVDFQHMHDFQYISSNITLSLHVATGYAATVLHLTRCPNIQFSFQLVLSSAAAVA